MAEMSEISQAWSGILASFKIYAHVLYVMSLNLYKIIFQLTQCQKMLNMFCTSKKTVCVTGGKETHIL